MAHILIAEDEPRVRQLVRRHLEQEGHTVAEAQNGLDAWRQTRHERFDLMITDLTMPEINGIELVTLMEADESTASMPVLLMGNRSPDRDQDEDITIPVARSKGAVLLIKKPFNPREMVMLANRLLNRELS